jgi:membrane protein
MMATGRVRRRKPTTVAATWAVLLWRLSRFDYNPTHWFQAVLKVMGLAWHRSQGRNVMLYVGGVSFSALLATFPALALLIGLYTVLFTPEQAAHQAEGLARILPPGAEGLFASELTRLAHTPIRIVSVQSVIAVLIALYASQRGVKALLAGLSLIHDEERPRGFVGFNILALVVALAGFALMSVVAAAFLALRVMASTFALTPFALLPWVFSEWIWAFVGMSTAFTLIYRWAMSSRPVAWRASILGGVVAAGLSLFLSWAGAIYVGQIAHLGATYGSIATVVILLIWLSWNVSAVFYGAALATEFEIVLGKRRPRLLEDMRGHEPKVVPPAPRQDAAE